MRSTTVRTSVCLLGVATVAVARAFALRPTSNSVPAARAPSTGTAPVERPSRSDQPAAPLLALEREANQLLGGGVLAFDQRLAALRGFPVVVNQWASWCGSCRYEFPFFQRLAGRYRGEVGFLGVDSQDARRDASRFVAEFPVPFPHYFDPDGVVARVFRGGRAFPTTAFYNRAGQLTKTHVGAYATEARLDADIRRYTLGG